MTFAYRSALHTSKMIMLHLLERERGMCLGQTDCRYDGARQRESE